MKYVVTAPNKNYTGESATVMFHNGVAETDSEHLAGWFKTHGYSVEEVEQEPQADIPPAGAPAADTPPETPPENAEPEKEKKAAK